MNKRTKLGLAGLALLGITSVLSPRVNATGNRLVSDSGTKNDDSKKTTITVPSIRNVPNIDGKSYVGVPFTYEVLDFYARRADESQTQFFPRFFYDVDNDGKWGAAEEAMEKAGIPMYMSDEFTQKFLEAYRKNDEEKILGYMKQIKEFQDIAKKSLEMKLGGSQSQTPTAEEVAKKNRARGKTLENKTQDYSQAHSQNPKKVTTKTNAVPVSLIIGANSNFALNSYNASLGIRVNPAEDKRFGLAALVNAGFGLDNQTDSTSVTYHDNVFNSDITMSGTKNNTNKRSIGGAFEISYSPFIFGLGADYNTSIDETKEQISSGSAILKSNSLSVPKSNASAKVYGGLELGPIRFLAGYDSVNGAYFGTGAVIKLNPGKE